MTTTECAPNVSRYLTVTLAPGCLASTSGPTAAGDATARPPMLVITSPAARPAEAAGPPATTLAISAPAEPSSVAATWMPRNAVGPTWMTAELFPASIAAPILSALPMGIA